MSLSRRVIPALFLALLISALATRMGFWFRFEPEAFVEPDTVTYLEPGLTFWRGGGFPSFSRPPVYPLVLGALSEFISSSPAMIALCQIAFAIISLSLLIVLLIRSFGAGCGLLTGLLVALDLPSAIINNKLLSETVFTVILVISTWALIQLRDQISRSTPSILFALLCGFLLASLSLCRPIAFLFFVPAVFWLWREGGRASKGAIKCLVAVFIGAVAPVLLFIERNQNETGHRFLSTIAATNIYEYRAAWNLAVERGEPFLTVQAQLRQVASDKSKEFGWNVGDRAEWESAEGSRILLSNPRLTFKQFMFGLARFFLGNIPADIGRQLNLADSSPSAAGQHTMSDSVKRITDRLFSPSLSLEWLMFTWVNFHGLLMILGLGLSVRLLFGSNLSSERRSFIKLFLLVVGYFAILSAGAECNYRFRVPIMPVLSALGAIGWCGYIPRGRAEKCRT